MGEEGVSDGDDSIHHVLGMDEENRHVRGGGKGMNVERVG